jgi:hypothetical protein
MLPLSVEVFAARWSSVACISRVMAERATSVISTHGDASGGRFEGAPVVELART